MNEKSVRVAIHRALQYRAYWPLKVKDTEILNVICAQCGHAGTIQLNPYQPGRPDTEARHPNFPTALIEVKDSKEKAFAFSEISPEQRRYLSSWEAARAQETVGGGAYIGIGEIVTGPRDELRSILVCPWSVWLDIEKIYKDLGRESAPWNKSRYKKYDENIPDLRGLFLLTPWFFLEKRDGEWHFSDAHPLSVQSEISDPFFRKGKND